MGLVERDAELAVLAGAVAAVRAGRGAVVVLRGDAGIGKSALLAEAVGRAAGLRVLRTGCDPLSTPRPLGPFRDLAAELGPAGRLLDDGPPARVYEQLFAALAERPTVLVVDDLHWADAATVEVLRFVVRRVATVPLLVLLAHRDHEVGPGHSVRPLLGDLARAEGAVALPVAPLSPSAVGTLVGGSGLDPARVHAVTAGNPFFVGEVLKEPHRPLPSSVRDAVLGRAGELSPEDFGVLQLIAAAPDRLDDRLLPAVGVDLPTLRRLDATGLVTRGRGGLVFRHELARQAVESTVPPGGSARLHARLLAALLDAGITDPAVLTHHAVAAGDVARAHGSALAAAAEAVRAGAHSEAVAFLTTALEHGRWTQDDASSSARADLLEQLSFEQYMTSRLPEAIANVRATFALRQRSSDRAGLARAYQKAAVYEYYSGRREQAEQLAVRAAEVASGAGGTGPAAGDDVLLALGGARAVEGYLAYMRSDTDGSVAAHAAAARIAEQTGDAALDVRSRMFQACTALAGGQDEARGVLAALIEEARLLALDELASTGYSHVVNLDVERHALRDAERVLADSLPFSVERDIPICRQWQTALRARLRLVQGRYESALEDAGTVLDGDGMPVARLWPLLVQGLVALRRTGSGGSELDRAWSLAERIDEPLRRVAVLTALAEQMWLTGRPDERVLGAAPATVTGPWPAAARWAVGDLAVWLGRLGLLADRAVVAAALPEPFRSALLGRPQDAAQWWRRAGEPFMEALAWCDCVPAADRVRGLAGLDLLGVTATADRVRAQLRADGVTQLPARPRSSSRANPAGLTNRQLEVARLVARGMTNAEIAAQLFISAKTTDHHVSAVLAKLELPDRRAVVRRAGDLGLA